jgi:hypothetical protein
VRHLVQGGQDLAVGEVKVLGRTSLVGVGKG